MKQRIIHGAFVDMVTPDELYKALRKTVRRTRVRVPAAITLDAAGTTGAIKDIYKVPIGTEFEVRRISFDLGNVIASNLVPGSIALNAAGNYIRYLRSGQFMEYGLPINPTSTGPKVPGVQTWGEEQGVYLRNGDVFQIDAALSAASANTTLSVTLEGILTENREDA